MKLTICPADTCKVQGSMSSFRLSAQSWKLSESYLDYGDLLNELAPTGTCDVSAGQIVTFIPTAADNNLVWQT